MKYINWLKIFCLNFAKCLFLDSKSEIISASNIYKKYKDKNKITYTLKQKRDLNKMNKKIIDISNIVIILSNDIIYELIG